MPPILEFKSVGKKVGGRRIKGLSFKLEEGNFIIFEGESKSGKTVLFRLSTALELPDSGDVLLLGRNTKKLKGNKRNEILRKVGLVPENPLILHDRTVLQNLKLASYLGGGFKREKFEETLNQIGIGDLLEKMPKELSKGEALLVNLAIVSLKNPIFIVLDNPLSGRDSDLESITISFLREEWVKGKAILVFSTPGAFPHIKGSKVMKLEEFSE